MESQRGPGADEELTSLRREVVALRQRVAELQRRTARHKDGEEALSRRDVEVTVSAREELLVEAERIAHVGSWVWDLEAGAVFWSDELYRILGYDPEVDRASTEAFFARIHEDDRARVQAAAQLGVVTGVCEQVDYRVALPDGQLRFVSMDGAMLFDAAGKLRRMVGTVADLTAERMLQQTMQNSLQLLEDAQSMAQMGSWVFDRSIERIEWSTGMYRVLGLDPSTPPSVEAFLSAVASDERASLLGMHERSLSGDWTEQIECRLVRANGEIRHARIQTIARKDALGRIEQYRGTLVDISDQVELAQRLTRVGKTESVARLAGGIAHDFNNLLTVIGANLELWAEASGREGEIVDAQRAVQSARSLTDRLLSLGRRAPLERKVVDPNELVAKTVDLLRRVIGDRIQVSLVPGVRIPAIHVDPALFEQALINLVINARDAMPEGGTVTLSIRSVERQAVPWVEIEVADEGVGMAPELSSRIFEPFFTTKGERGTGLGLPTVLGTIEQHGGVVEVDSELGRGSRFRVCVPASLRSKVESLAPPLVRAIPGEPSREILVVEDEPLVAAVIARTLERKGHRPLLAHRPSEALRLWAAHPSVSLVISDVSMAEMRGPELVSVLRQSGREFRVVYVTGYQDDDDSFDSGGDPVLSKPFSPRDLMRVVAETSV